MSVPSTAPSRWGVRRVTAVLLLLLALLGLWWVPAQIEVFALEPHWPDARTLPAVFLGLLAFALVLRAVLEWRKPDHPLGTLKAHLRVVALVLSLGLGLALMQSGRGAAGLALIAVLVAPILSNGPMLKPTLASIAFAMAAYVVAVFVLHIPLH